jgi:hypothetical protein
MEIQEAPEVIRRLGDGYPITITASCRTVTHSTPVTLTGTP